MTTVTVVSKDGRIAIAADTLAKWGCGKEDELESSRIDVLLANRHGVFGMVGLLVQSFVMDEE